MRIKPIPLPGVLGTLGVGLMAAAPWIAPFPWPLIFLGCVLVWLAFAWNSEREPRT